MSDYKHIDLNGRIPKVGDVIYRVSTANFLQHPEIITAFTGSGNPKLSRVASNGLLYATGYITSCQFVILDTPNVSDEILERYNEERKNLGLAPMKKYGNS